MKKSKQRIVLILVCIVFSALLGIQLSRPNLPSHNGKNLDEWLHEINRAGSYPKLKPVNEALDAMGTNCLPFLLNYMTHLARMEKESILHLVTSGQYSVETKTPETLRGLCRNLP